MGTKLKGKVALVTGASGGLGSATVLEFAREGARGIGVHYSSARERAQELASQVRELGSEALPVRADVSSRGQARMMVEEVVGAFGSLDVLVCFAGHPLTREDWFSPFEELTEKQLLRPLRVDLLGSVYCAQAAFPHLRQSQSGRIVFISSTPALTGDTSGISYLLAKGALLSLTRALALYMGPYNVHVNCLALGSIATEAMAAFTEEERGELEEEAALRRMGTPEEVARKAVYLASEDSEFQTGTVLVVDGGYAMR
jgi:3-oxoacyl-[acyl-carrier protein] reductase